MWTFIPLILIHFVLALTQFLHGKYLEGVESICWVVMVFCVWKLSEENRELRIISKEAIDPHAGRNEGEE